MPFDMSPTFGQNKVPDIAWNKTHYSPLPPVLKSMDVKVDDFYSNEPPVKIQTYQSVTKWNPTDVYECYFNDVAQQKYIEQKYIYATKYFGGLATPHSFSRQDANPAPNLSLLFSQAADFFQSNPDSWCQGTMAKNYQGESVGARGSEAVRFCAMGAMEKLSGIRLYENLNLVRKMYGIFECVTNRTVPGYNDAAGRTVHDVIGALRAASSEARCQGV